jgi:hypothetical protein
VKNMTLTKEQTAATGQLARRLPRKPIFAVTDLAEVVAAGMLLLLSGCAYNPRVTVYGATGKPYIAPDLCAAVIQCKGASEPSCYYNSTLQTTTAGVTEESVCKQAK